MLKGKNAIITGANRGIGQAIVKLFAQNGANIWACARTPSENFEKELNELSQQYNLWIKPVYFDLTDEENIKSAIRQIIKEKQSVHILVNVAGIPHGAFLQMTSMQVMRDVFEVNFFSQMLLMQLVSRIMMRQKKGSIVNFSSVAGLDGDPGYSAYGSSKAALAFATRSVSKELAAYGIRVNAVAPGLVKTRMMDQMEEGAREGMINGASLKRVAEPEEIAKAVLFLASDQSSFITGQILRVDGGL